MRTWCAIHFRHVLLSNGVVQGLRDPAGLQESGDSRRMDGLVDKSHEQEQQVVLVPAVKFLRVRRWDVEFGLKYPIHSLLS